MKNKPLHFAVCLLLVIVTVFGVTGCGQPAAEPQPAAAPAPVTEATPEPTPTPEPEVTPEATPEPEAEAPVKEVPQIADLTTEIPEGWREPIVIGPAALILGDEAGPGDSNFYIGVCITNKGNVKAENVLIKLEALFEPCFEWMVPEVAPGEVVRVNVPVQEIHQKLQYHSNAYILNLKIDPNEAVPDADRRNNILTTQIKVMLPKPPEVTLISPEDGAKLDTLTPRLEWTNPEANVSYSITVTQVLKVTENGETTYQAIYTPIDVDVQDTFYDVPQGKLDPGATYRWRVRSSFGGRHSDYSEYRIFIAPDGTDLSPFNVREWGFAAMTIGTAEEVKGEHASPSDKDNYLGVSVVNWGNKPAEGVIVALYWEDHELFRGYIAKLNGQSATRAWRSWPEIKKAFAMEPGPKVFEMRIDPDNLVKEADDENNNMFETVIVP